jgi:diaminopimelate decarboxylase
MTLAAGSRSVAVDGRVAGIDATALAARFGTPLFVYDLDLVTDRVRQLGATLPPSFELAFAVKANPLLAVLQHLRVLGLGADVASAGELRHALRAGFDPPHVVVTGPGKGDALLAAAVEAQVGVVTVESRGELARLAAIAEAAGRVQPVLLRLSVDGSATEPRRIIGDDGAGKFGMDEADLRAAAGRRPRRRHGRARRVGRPRGRLHPSSRGRRRRPRHPVPRRRGAARPRRAR